MRIISGSHRGRIITPPKFFKARPTTDVAKESIFNIIDNNIYIEDIRVLDIFAGTGSISYEFASRGCNDITTIDISKKYLNYIDITAERLNLKQIHTIHADALKFISQSHGKYDMIFADPPYDMEGIGEIPDLIFRNGLLNPEGWLIIEHSTNIKFSEKKHFDRHKKYGKVNFSIFIMPEENDETTQI